MDKFPTLLVACSCILLGACARNPAPTPPAPPPGTKVAVVTGMKNQLFEAASPQRIKMMLGTTSRPITDKDGHVRGVSIAKDNNEGVPLNCECPGGCSPPSNPGDVIVIGCVAVTDGHTAQCEGDCTAPNSSCFGCSFVFPQPPTDDPRAAWVVRSDQVLAQP